MPERLAGLASPGEGSDEGQLEWHVDLSRRYEGGGALEQVQGGAEVLPRQGPATGGGQVAPRRICQPGVVVQAELAAVAPCLLQVIAEELLQLDKVSASLLEPGREVPVQVGAGRFRQAGVGSVADQQVVEAEAVLAHELRLHRADQPLADE